MWVNLYFFVGLKRDVGTVMANEKPINAKSLRY